MKFQDINDEKSRAPEARLPAGGALGPLDFVFRAPIPHTRSSWANTITRTITITQNNTKKIQRRFMYSKDFVVFPVSRHFRCSKDFVLFSVSRHFLY